MPSLFLISRAVPTSVNQPRGHGTGARGHTGDGEGRAFAHPCMGIVKRERRSGSKLLVPHAPIEGVDQGPMSVISLSWDSFFVRPGAVSSSRPASFTEAPRAAAVKAGRRCVVTTSSGI